MDVSSFYEGGNKMDKKIVQIIPAPKDLYATYRDTEGDITAKVVCLGLTNEGEVVLRDICSSGYIEEVIAARNFIGIRWGR